MPITRKTVALAGVAGCVLFIASLAPAQTRPESQPDAEQRQDDPREQRRAQITQNLLSEYDLSDPQIEIEMLRAGCQVKDCIPALTDPKRASVEEAQYPAADARVVSVAINGEAVAYPLGILNFHEIANDTVGGVPIAVVYCPLCDSVTVMERTLRTEGANDRVLEFGVSGLLANSNVVMYERNTDGLWSQVFGRAITGPDAGKSLRHLPVKMMTYADFQRNHPNGEVLTTETGHERPYDRNPYAEYFTSDRIFMAMEFGDALPAKTLGLGIKAGDVMTFVPADAAEKQSIHVATPMGEIIVSAEPDVGMIVERAPDNVIVMQTFWHSWSAYFPETSIAHGSKAATQPATQAE